MFIHFHICRDRFTGTGEGCAPFLAFANGGVCTLPCLCKRGCVKGGANFLIKAIFRIYNKNKIEIK